MSDTTFQPTRQLPDPATAPALFDGVLQRRVWAFLIDLVLIGIMVVGFTLVGFIAGFFTFGLAWLGTVVIIPAVIVFYYGGTLGSPRRATVGMQAMDIVLTPTGTTLLNGPVAFLHAALFWLPSWISWPVSLAFALFTPRRQMIHDYLTGTLMVRRSPMERHWRSVREGY